MVARTGWGGSCRTREPWSNAITFTVYLRMSKYEGHVVTKHEQSPPQHKGKGGEKRGEKWPWRAPSVDMYRIS